MSQKFEKLKTLLKELFQLDQPDLDFGLYRIMHAKSAEVTQFLDKDLLPQVRQAFGLYKTADKAELEKELTKAIEQARSLGADPETLPKVKELRAKLDNETVDISALENEVYDHLFSFFRRYYSEGDFLAKRVYRPGVYAIPYEGEEVKLHWANRDQYYIKTSEYLRDYAFRLKPDDAVNPLRVHFRLVDAAEGEHGNIKAAEGKDRVFILAAEDFIAEEEGDLVLRFAYRPATLADWPENERDEKKKPPAQTDLTAFAVSRILALKDAAFALWIAELAKPHVNLNGEAPGYSRLEGHLKRYTARNTFDYFIHKDLGGFLRRELDFYVKNEVMHLDDIESDTAPRVEQYLSKIKVIRRIAGKIIDFLAQLEDFQKKLWLKKKFVVETQYCITLDLIHEEFYPEIAANDAQREEWVRLLCLDDQIRADSAAAADEIRKKPCDLYVDTAHFSQDFCARIIAALSSETISTLSIAIHSENLHALRLIGQRYSGAVRTIYIDPPYNTGQDGFVYKDAYKESSWTSMMSDRLATARNTLTSDGVIFVSINEIQRGSLEALLGETFGRQNRIEELIWARDTVSNNSPAYSTNHEYIEVYARDRAVVESNPKMFREQRDGFTNVMQLVAEIQPNYPSLDTVQEALRDLYREHKEQHLVSEIEAGLDRKEAEKTDPWKGLYPYKFAEYRDLAGNLIAPENAKDVGANLWIFREVEPSMPSGKQAENIRDPDSDNYRFFDAVHPITGERGKAPKRGWAFPKKALGNRPSFEGYCSDHRIVFKGEKNIAQLKYFLHEVESVVSTSVIRQYSDGEPKLEAMFGKKGLIDNPKPPSLVQKLIAQTCNKESVVLDFFAGSGTTAVATLQENRKDSGNRAFIVVEVNSYFDDVLVPRIKKAVHAPDWAEGKPVAREGISAAVKYVRLESYEDALNNLEPRRTPRQDDLLASAEAQGPDRLKEQYMLRYMLDVETRGSQSLLNVKAFADPTAYKLKVKRPGSDESREVNVDLLETFNWLIGLTVQGIAAPQTFAADFERDTEGRLGLKGRLRQDAAGPWWFRTVTGATPDGRRALIIWRKLTGDPEQDNLVLDTWFTRAGYSAKDSEFGLIYVNGDNNLENLKSADDTWKVRLIEEDFHRLMFDTEGL
ncbi:site-specific DNA-methyltransferase [Elstera cyanobacteriorum]|uniref:site-specific DNA-methyltransferase n=1 Tax=Elstera cyanobacteriorum TaxID=2022747 RepID=UPI002355BC66|nr:site-specific DNA-methyltransferase [Elstera cyanobacteriorum]MCK6443325.1 site-specific DNA-methyltransferase [Elstera cyanobacteriorum]